MHRNLAINLLYVILCRPYVILDLLMWIILPPTLTLHVYALAVSQHKRLTRGENYAKRYTFWSPGWRLTRNDLYFTGNYSIHRQQTAIR